MTVTRNNSATTGLLDTRDMKWADQIGEALAVPINVFSRRRQAGALALVCTGTWALAGVELPAPVTAADRAQN